MVVVMQPIVEIMMTDQTMAGQVCPACNGTDIHVSAPPAGQYGMARCQSQRCIEVRRMDPRIDSDKRDSVANYEWLIPFDAAKRIVEKQHAAMAVCLCSDCKGSEKDPTIAKAC